MSYVATGEEGLMTKASNYDHMCYDVKSGPCSIIILLEAPQELLDFLKAPVSQGPPAKDGESNRFRPSWQHFGIRGLEPGDSCADLRAQESGERYTTALFQKVQ